MYKAATDFGFDSLVATRLAGHDKQASSDEASSSESTPVLRTNDPTPNANEPNLWGVKSQYQVYIDARMLNKKSSDLVCHNRVSGPHTKFRHSPRGA